MDRRRLIASLGVLGLAAAEIGPGLVVETLAPFRPTRFA
jgi:hypothetical protein